MCCKTKEKIAAAVKDLMRQKSIRKITVQDIMDETGMKRQSFYYHFQDIYDVLEWICSRELIYKVDVGTTFEEWLMDLMETIEADRSFYRKLANEMEWKKMAEHAKEPVSKQVEQFLEDSVTMQGSSLEERSFLIDFFSTSIIYYLLDFVTNQRNMTEEERSRQITLTVQTLSRFNFGGGMALANA